MINLLRGGIFSSRTDVIFRLPSAYLPLIFRLPSAYLPLILPLILRHILGCASSPTFLRLSFAEGSVRQF